MNIRQVAHTLSEEYKAFNSWNEVGERRGISGGMAYRVAVELYIPRDFVIRQKLGLTDHAKTMVCPHCSEKICYETSEYPCPYCGVHFVYESGHTDHIIPVSRGGPDVEWNKVECCHECNLGKGKQTPWEWLGEDWQPLDFFHEKFEKVKLYHEKQEQIASSWA